MSTGLNTVMLIGNLGGNPELRETRGAKKSVCNFRLATNTSKGQGEFRKERTEWHPIVVWGRLAELCTEHLITGSKVWIEGYIQTRKWTDKDSNPRVTSEVVAEKVIFLDVKTTELLATNMMFESMIPGLEELLTKSIGEELSVSEVAILVTEYVSNYTKETAEAFENAILQSSMKE